MPAEMSDGVSRVYVEADELQHHPGPRPPEQLPRLGATIGAGLGFSGSILYVICWLLFQLAVRSSGATTAALMPTTAIWLTSLMVFGVFGTVSSLLLGAGLGALGGAVQTRTWKSQSALLAWTFGVVVALMITILVHIAMAGYGFHPDLGRQLRFVTIPSMIFVIEGGLTGLLTRYLGRRRS